jgi:aminoglycoside phosphotransferase (APT) family kinase protein
VHDKHWKIKMTASLREPLENFIKQQTGQSVEIMEMTPLAGGASRDSWAIEAKIGDDVEKLVLRRDFPTTMNENALTRAQEYRLMQVAHECGVKVARMRWQCDDPTVLGLPFFIMDFVEGVSIGRKVITAPELAKAREVLPEQMAEQLARIHTIDPESHQIDFLQRPRDNNPSLEAVASTYTILDRLGVHVPALEFALRWCERHAPLPQRITFLHGDFRVGNLLVDTGGLAAVIDWEFAHIGDPLEEIGYLCMRDWRFGSDHLRAGGLSDRERFIQAYEHFSGLMVDRSTADWWEIMGNIRWAAICLSQAERHLSGRDPSVELASLGRRSAEMQLEALMLIEKAGL